MLNTLKRIVQSVNAAHSLPESLRIMVKCVREALDTKACTIYLIDHQHKEYVLMATEGLNPMVAGRVRIPLGQALVGLVGRREEPINLADASSHPDFLYHPDAGEDAYASFLGVPIIQQRRLLGVLTVQQEDQRYFDESEEAFMVTIAAQLAGVIAQAESTGALADLLYQSVPVDSSNQIYTGQACMMGIGIGQGVVVYPRADLTSVSDRRISPDQVGAEQELFNQALQAVQSDIQELSDRLHATLPASELTIFGVYLQILNSRSLTNEVHQHIAAGFGCQGALRKAIYHYMDQFKAMEDHYLRERAVDFYDLGQRLLARLQANQPKVIDYPEKTILIGEELTASDLAEVPEGRLSGMVSIRGSSNSHVAILARALGVPSVMGVKGVQLGHLAQKQLIVDGYIGQMHVNPSQDVYDEYQGLLHEEIELNDSLAKLRSEPAETPDGHKVKLCVNVGLATDAGLSLSVGAEGIGLYRSEVPFMIRDRFPAEQEQCVIYRQLLQAFAPRPVTMRTLDIGGDKSLPYFPIDEINPFLGWRGIRVTLDHPDVFLIQLRAMLMANSDTGNLQILLPMVSNVNEVDESLRHIQQAYQELLDEGLEVSLPPIGVMIEVPSAVYLAKELARRVDFISVGSNDLIQYLLAVDRNNIRVASLYDGFHPAVIRSLMQIAESVHQLGKTVSICGELASDPAAVILLLAMGYDMLSMNSTSLLRVKWVVRNVSMASARKVLNEVLQMDNSTIIRLHMEKVIEESGLGGLIRAGKH